MKQIRKSKIYVQIKEIISCNSALKDLLSSTMTKNLIFLKLKQNGKIRYLV